MSEPEDGGAYGVAKEALGKDTAGESHGAARALQASPHKGGSRSNPSERMLIASYIPMTQPSEPPRSPFKVHTPPPPAARALCACRALLHGGPLFWARPVHLPRRAGELLLIPIRGCVPWPFAWGARVPRASRTWLAQCPGSGRRCTVYAPLRERCSPNLCRSGAVPAVQPAAAPLPLSVASRQGGVRWVESRGGVVPSRRNPAAGRPRGSTGGPALFCRLLRRLF